MNGREEEMGIPVMRSPPNLMASGPNGSNLAAAARRSHPVEVVQQQSAGGDDLDLDAVRRLYGSGLAMRLATERQMAAQVGGRLPGLDAAPASNAMLDTLTGNDMRLDFGDYLNLAANRPEARPDGTGPVTDIGPHALMEAKLGL
eukprot:scaffold421377_cov55-Attheya_sp.AAC.3